MPKQNLVNLARHSNNIVPVPRIKRLYIPKDNPDGRYYGEYAEGLVPLSNEVEIDAEKHFLFENKAGSLNGLLHEDSILHITNLGDEPARIGLVENTPTLVERTLTVSNVPANDETISVAGVTYTFVTTPGGKETLGKYCIIMDEEGVSASKMAAHIGNAINGIADNKVGAGTLPNPHVSATVEGAAITLKSRINTDSPAKARKIGGWITISDLSGKIELDDDSGAVGNTMFKWVETPVGYLYLAAETGYDLYLPKWHDLTNANESGEITLAIMFLE